MHGLTIIIRVEVLTVLIKFLLKLVKTIGLNHVM